MQLILLFFSTFFSALIASAPPGLLNMNAAKIGVEKGKANGVIFGLGITTMVMIQAYISVRIAKYFLKHPDVIALLMQIAVVIFAFLSIFFFLKAKKVKVGTKEFQTAKKRNSFTKGFFLTALNLLTVPFYSGLNTVFHSQGLMNYKVIDEIVFILGAGLGTFLLMYLYVFYFNKMERKTNRFSKNANYILSALMLVLLIITLVRIYYH